MLKKNSILTGFLLALVFPLIAMGIAYLLRTNVTILNRPALPYLAAIALNLIVIRICIRKDLDQTGRGIMFATFACMLLLFLLKIHPIK